MTIEAVGRDVQHAVIEPADMDLAGEGDVLHLCEWLDPIQTAPVLRPKPFGVGDRFRIHPLVFGGVDPSGFGNFVRYRKECGVAHRALRVSPWLRPPRRAVPGLTRFKRGLWTRPSVQLNRARQPTPCVYDRAKEPNGPSRARG